MGLDQDLARAVGDLVRALVIVTAGSGVAVGAWALWSGITGGHAEHRTARVGRSKGVKRP